MPKTFALHVTTPTDLEIVMTRVFAAPRHLVFEALTTPAFLKRWLLGPPGWEMIVCEVAAKIGDPYRYEWRDAGGKSMGIHGVCRELEAPVRIVNTELMDGFPNESLVTTTLVENSGQTTLTTTVRYQSRAIRDAMLKTGMERGVAASYDRLESLLSSPNAGTGERSEQP